MLVSRDDDEEKAGRIAGVSGPAMIALGLSISADELAIGFSLGLTGLPAVPVIVAIAVQTLIVSQLGLAIGSLVSERFREHAEQVAGIALIALGCYLVVSRAIS
jgi:putative Mn2+ efflux pump MntP